MIIKDVQNYLDFLVNMQKNSPAGIATVAG